MDGNMKEAYNIKIKVRHNRNIFPWADSLCLYVKDVHHIAKKKKKQTIEIRSAWTEFWLDIWTSKLKIISYWETEGSGSQGKRLLTKQERSARP